MRTLPACIVSNNAIIIQNGNCTHKGVQLVEMQKLQKCKNPMLQHIEKIRKSKIAARLLEARFCCQYLVRAHHIRIHAFGTVGLRSDTEILGPAVSTFSMLQHAKIENRNRPLGSPFLLPLPCMCSPHQDPCIWNGWLAIWYRDFGPGSFDIGICQLAENEKIDRFWAFLTTKTSLWFDCVYATRLCMEKLKCIGPNQATGQPKNCILDEKKSYLAF